MLDGDDPYPDDPYRGSAYRDAAGRCPRCAGLLLEHPSGSLACPRDCGEWLTRAALCGTVELEELDACEPDVGSLIGRPFPPARCALCSLTMAVRLHRGVTKGVTFDLCLEHGVWLDRGEREHFEDAIALHRRDRHLARP